MKNKPKIVLSSGLIAILFSVVNIYANAVDDDIIHEALSQHLPQDLRQIVIGYEKSTLIKDKDIGKKLVCPITGENLYTPRKIISYYYVNKNLDTLLLDLEKYQPESTAIYQTNDDKFVFYGGNKESIIQLTKNENINFRAYNEKLEEYHARIFFKNYPHLQGYSYNLWLKMNSDGSISTNFGDILKFHTYYGKKTNQLLKVTGSKEGPDRFLFKYHTDTHLWTILGSPVQNFKLMPYSIACYIQGKEDKAADGETKTGE